MRKFNRVYRARRGEVNTHVLKELGLIELDLSWCQSQLNLVSLAAQKPHSTDYAVGLAQAVSADLRLIMDEVQRLKKQIKQTP